MKTVNSHAPKVTIALPLYHSQQFIDIIIHNIETIDYPNLEYIVSDRHCADEALSRLRAHFADDARIRFLAATDEIDWVDHYNLLMRAATGEYMMWMPHDDSYPANYVHELVAVLEADPLAMLAFGQIVAVDRQGAPVEKSFAYEMLVELLGVQRDWNAWDALRLLVYWNPGIAMRGLFRRQAIVAADHFILRPDETILADAAWIFGVGLLGPLRFVPHVHCTKRYYEASTHAQWFSKRRAYEPQHRRSRAKLQHTYVARNVPTWTMRARCRLGLWLWHERRLRGRRHLLAWLLLPPHLRHENPRGP